MSQQKSTQRPESMLSSSEQSQSSYVVHPDSEKFPNASFRIRKLVFFVVLSVAVVVVVLIPIIVLAGGSRQQETSSVESAASESNALGPLLPSFKDTTASAGFNSDAPRYKLYGGPTVVDLDRDGFPDVLLCYHDSTYVKLLFNQRNGSFIDSPWGAWFDTHGIVATPISPFTSNMRFSLSVGGSIGRNPRPPYMYEVDSATREVTNVTDQMGITLNGGRGRTALYADLSNGQHPQYPDALFLNAEPNDEQALHHFAYENIEGEFYQHRDIAGNFTQSQNALATVTDIDNDGTMEIITYGELSVWQIVGPFEFEEITSRVLPEGLARRGTVAIAELDFDNDGDFDLYVARRKSWWHHENTFHDYLLENRDGQYVDIGEQAGLPRNTSSRGVTVGDFNNDGWIDILVVQQNGPDVFLFNNGNGTFRTVDGLLEKRAGGEGDHAVGVDYDMDGKLDIMYGEGNHNNATGSYRLWRNTMKVSSTASKNFVHVRVGNAPDLSCTPLNAVIQVDAGALSMVRRVASPGDSIAHSYLETQHFGIGPAKKIDLISVNYTNGLQLTLRDVRPGALVQIGEFAVR